MRHRVLRPVGGPRRALVATLLALGSAHPLLAGGPLVICDPAAGRGFAFATGVATPIFTDQGLLGPLSNAGADLLADAATASWASVPTSSFDAAVAGDIGVDIDPTNLLTVLGVETGHGGVDIIYDADGAILRDVFGAPPGVGGIAGPEFIDAATCTITEAWTIVNGAAIDPGDVGGASFAGVLTHELGHAIGLAHSQTNGAGFFFANPPGPAACPLPYGGAPAAAHVETMYPFIDVRPGAVGVEMATVDRLDDAAALSNLYPAAGWPAGFPRIDGTVFLGDGVTPVTGINVVIRNLADPFDDANSILSGSSSGGFLGPDGSFSFHGLQTGESYVLYLDGIVAGGFSVGLGPLIEEEFWNDALEGSDPTTDDACSFASAIPDRSVDLVLNIPPDPSEPNDSLPEAAPIPCSLSADRIIYPDNDVDFFTLDLAVESFLRLDVDATEIGSSLDPMLGLFDDGFGLLAFNDDSPAPLEPSTFDSYLLRRLQPGRYHVGVSSFDDNDFDGAGGLTIGTYTLTPDCLALRGPVGGGDLLGATGNALALIDVDRQSGAGSFRAPYGTFGAVSAIAFDQASTLFASAGFGVLLTLDPVTGGETFVGSHGGGAVNGLAFVGTALYGTLFDGVDTTLVTLDTTDAGLTVIGSTGLPRVTGIAFDELRQVLLGVTGGGPSDLVRLDLASGLATVVGPTGFESLGALTFAADRNLYAGVNASASTAAGSLVRIDPVLGTGTLVGATGFQGLTGLAFVPGGASSALAVPATSPSASMSLFLLLLASAWVLLRHGRRE